MLCLFLFACGDSGVSVHDAPPSATIKTPAAGERFVADHPVVFTAELGDDLTGDDDLDPVWSVENGGTLSGTHAHDGRLWTFETTLSTGEQWIVLSVTDQRGQEATDSVWVDVIDNTPPTVTPVWPGEGGAVEAGEAFDLTVAFDDETLGDLTELVLTWTLDGAPLIGAPVSPESDGQASAPVDALSAGEHDLVVTAEDPGGAQGHASWTLRALLPDDDGDGYLSWELGGDDCDDEDPDVHPLGTEVCDPDDMDEDCDGLVDDEDPDVTGQTEGYLDLDGDGFGDDDTLIWTCGDEGFSLEPGDCDDHDDAIHPDAEEICDDGVDNDCDGDQGQCRWSGEQDSAAAEALFYGERAQGHLGSTLAAGDLDGDGHADLATGAPFDDTVGNKAGRVVWFAGPHTGETTASTPELLGSSQSAELGSSLLLPGDLDGDGLAELVAGAPGALTDLDFSPGRVGVASGGWTGTVGLDELPLWLDGEDHGDDFGAALAHADFDGDGFAELVVGAPKEDSLANNAGATYVFAGPVGTDAAGEDALVKLRGEKTSDESGTTVADLGDLDGDGYPDLGIGAPGDDSAVSGGGAAYVISGDRLVTTSPLSLRLDGADAKLTGDQSQAKAGTALVGAGDLDGDGQDDLIVGASHHGRDTTGANTGAAWVVYGPVTGTWSLADADHVILGGTKNDELGAALSAGGDFDGDGTLDLLLGAPGGDDASGRATGLAYVFYGPLDDRAKELVATADADAWFPGLTDLDHGGGAVAGHTDLDGDGKADAVVGMPQHGGVAGSGGAIIVAHGRGQ